MPSPVTVTARWVKGRPHTTASATAAVVATLLTTTPIMGGIPPVGTTFSMTARMSCRSPPWGYFVFKGTTWMAVERFNFWSVAVIRSMALGLLSSMAM